MLLEDELLPKKYRSSSGCRCRGSTSSAGSAPPPHAPRQARQVSSVPVLEGEAYRKAAAKYGADVFLLKTAEISEIFSAVRRGRAAKAGQGNR